MRIKKDMFNENDQVVLSTIEEWFYTDQPLYNRSRYMKLPIERYHMETFRLESNREGWFISTIYSLDKSIVLTIYGDYNPKRKVCKLKNVSVRYRNQSGTRVCKDVNVSRGGSLDALRDIIEDAQLKQ